MKEREALENAIALIFRLFNALPDGSGTLEADWGHSWDSLDEQSQKFVKLRRNQAWHFIEKIQKADPKLYQAALDKRVALDMLDKVIKGRE